jgi:hypothetical protein
MATHPVLAVPPRPFPCLLSPGQSVKTSHATDANTCFLDRTPAKVKRVESSGDEERQQGDGCGAPRRSPHEAESEMVTTTTDDVRSSEGVSTTLPARMNSSVSDSTPWWWPPCSASSWLPRVNAFYCYLSKMALLVGVSRIMIEHVHQPPPRGEASVFLFLLCCITTILSILVFMP